MTLLLYWLTEQTPAWLVALALLIDGAIVVTIAARAL